MSAGRSAGRERRERCLLLWRTPFGESSLVVQLFAEGAGRLHLLAKGAFRPTSGYFAVLDWFDTLELRYLPSARGELGTLARGDVLTRRRHLVEDPDCYRAALCALELLDGAARPEHRDGQLFLLAERTLDRLDRLAKARARSNPPGGSPRAELAAFELSYLDRLGLTPALASCAACGRRAPAPGRGGARTAFSVPRGGRLCPTCAEVALREGARVQSVESAAVELGQRMLHWATLQGTLADSQEPAPQDGARASHLASLVELLEHFEEYHLEFRPKSRSRVPPL